MPDTATDIAIRFRGVARRYEMGDQVVNALDGVDLDIHRNEYVAIVGASGSGKSTMMNIIGCLDRPTEGEYRLEDQDVGAMNEMDLARVRNREIGFVFQSFNLLPRANALKNVMQPLVFRGVKMDERKQMARQSLERVGLGDRVDHLPNQLSGGQRQRVAIARALVGEPAILLADEPTGNLDSRTTIEIMRLFDALHVAGQTIIMVTHETDIAEHCERVVRLEDGRVAEDYRNAQRRRALPEGAA
ncbi:ABC transporter ATP-binding protein [Marinihelvus fidelis]|uniref:ABC transporter ATP-binding protein n=1 Tax=Marinihelvus fidelis TaxID=2613842 RepID=A0A5N0TCU9_9GAMM|nr:ABC transporter ATP-binding protein [Marinihelvus fidelis]